MALLDQIEEAYHEVEAIVEDGNSLGSSLPQIIKTRIDSWKYGKYGWIAPVNLMMTAAWYKWINPAQDICLMWADDNDNRKIQGGFSIRSADESITVKLVAKYGLYKHFCSSNSGMQGSRALEKNQLRSMHKRIDRDSELGQRVSWDLQLFKHIMNDINEQPPEGAKLIFQYFLELAIRNKIKRQKELDAVPKIERTDKSKLKNIIFSSLNQIKDPQFVKVICSSLLNHLLSGCKKFTTFKLTGIRGFRTGADARARTPGDCWFTRGDDICVGCEVKDSTKQFDFEILSAVEDRWENNPAMEYYFLITAADEAVPETVRKDPYWQKKLASLSKRGLEVIPITVCVLFDWVELFTDIDEQFINDTSELLKRMKDLKDDTLEIWSAILNMYSN